MKKQTFGQRLRELREAAGLSQTELARRAKTGRPFLNRLEHDKQSPTLDMVQHLAQVLGIRIEKLIHSLERRPTDG